MTIYEAMWSAALVTAFLGVGCAVGVGILAVIYRFGEWAAKRPAWQEDAVVALAIIALAFVFFTALFYAGGA